MLVLEADRVTMSERDNTVSVTVTVLYVPPLQHFFTSFGARDRSYMMVFRLWQNALMDKVLTSPFFLAFFHCLSL